MPTLPGFRARSSGGRYVHRLHSVRPYMEKTRAAGKSSWTRAMYFSGSAAAVFVTYRTDRRSSRARRVADHREHRRHAGKPVTRSSGMRVSTFAG